MKPHFLQVPANLLAAGILLAALLNAFGQPVITTDPQSRANVLGTDAAFTVLATGTEPLAYQWQFATADLAGKTNATLVVTNVQAANTGDYTVVVTNVDGAVTSVVATLTVLIPPRITKQPTNQTASLFADATFRVTATGDQPLSYQWRFNDGELIGRSNNTLTVTNVQRTDAGNYNVLVTNSSGSVTSQVVTLTITPFNSIYCFGFSWTATHLNCLFTSDPINYYHLHACNGPVWPEFLSTNLGMAYVDANNHAQCGATAVDVLNQVTAFSPPAKPQLSAYFLWAGTDFWLDNETQWDLLTQTGTLNHSNAVDRLYAKGARQIVIQLAADDRIYPDIINGAGTNTALLSRISEASARLNAAFLDVMNKYSQSRPDLRIVWVDMFSKINDVLANPALYGFTKANLSALDDTSLTSKSFTGPGADYVFWDGLHGTTKLHELMTAWHLEALTNSILEKLEVTITGGSPNIQMNHLLIGRDYTLQSSPDLSNWQDIHPFTAAAGTNRWTGAADTAPAAFYRLKWQP